MAKALVWDLVLDDGSVLHVRKRTGRLITTFNRETGELLRTLYVYEAVHTLAGKVERCFVSDETLEELRASVARAAREEA